MPLLSSIEYASFFVYSKGQTDVSRLSKEVCYAMKNDSHVRLSIDSSPPQYVRIIPHLVEKIKQTVEGTQLKGFFSNNTLLVPAPRSSLTKPGSLHPTKLLCEHMVKHGLGKDSMELLERIVAVPKAAFAKTPEERPTIITHYASMAVKKGLEQPEDIMVVDDVVTSGGMLLASVSKLSDSFPNARIRAFAFIRTMSGMEVESFVAPCAGTITNRGERTRRVP